MHGHLNLYFRPARTNKMYSLSIGAVIIGIGFGCFFHAPRRQHVLCTLHALATTGLENNPRALDNGFKLQALLLLESSAQG